MASEEGYLYQKVGDPASVMNKNASGRGGGRRGGHTELSVAMMCLATNTWVHFGIEVNAMASIAARQASAVSAWGLLVV